MFTLSERSIPIPLVDIPATAGQVVSGAFDRALETNPIPMFMLGRELQAQNQGQKLTQTEVAAEAARFGVTVTSPKDGLTQNALRILIARRQDDIAYQTLQARSPGGVAVTGGEIAAGFAGALMDPLNLAAGMIPVLGGTKYAAALAGAASASSRAGLRLGIGAAEGLVGAALVEVPTLGLHRDLQDDYTLMDSLANIAFGTFASAGLRAGGGALRDLHLGIDRARQVDALRAIEPETWAALRQQAANAQERAFWGDLEAGFQRGEGIPEGMRASMERQRNAGEFDDAMSGWATDRARIGQIADEAIARRMENERQKMLAAGMEPDDALRAAFRAAHPETTTLLSQAELGQRILDDRAMADTRQRIAEGKGLIFVPSNAAQIEAAISGETHAAALRASVAQAVGGRRIDPTTIVQTDPVYGARRSTAEEARLAAQSSNLPENKVAADPEASRRADGEIAAAGKPPTPDVGGFADRVKAKAATGSAMPGPAPVPKSAQVIELETLLAATEARLRAEGMEGEALAAAKTKLAETLQRVEDYEKALSAVADCVQGRK